jgi:hypothetical protein
VRDMTFTEKLLTSRPPIKVAGRRFDVLPILMPDAPDLDGYLADSMLSGHTR